mgnify:CR=1 FL=1
MRKLAGKSDYLIIFLTRVYEVWRRVKVVLKFTLSGLFVNFGDFRLLAIYSTPSYFVAKFS